MASTLFASGSSVLYSTALGLALGWSSGGGGFGSQYMLLMDHYLADPTGASTVRPQGTTITEGIEVPVGWIPTPAVDPLNTQAIQAFWDQGPSFMVDAERNRDLFPWGPQNGRFFGFPVTRQKVYWVPYDATRFILTGAGAGLGPKLPM